MRVTTSKDFLFKALNSKLMFISYFGLGLYFYQKGCKVPFMNYLASVTWTKFTVLASAIFRLYTCYFWVEGQGGLLFVIVLGVTVRNDNVNTYYKPWFVISTTIWIMTNFINTMQKRMNGKYFKYQIFNKLTKSRMKSSHCSFHIGFR